jgi:regulator of protease activity HflC (stomatin/prohibitin superfamily)
MMLRTRIRKHEIGLVFRHGDFERVRRPGAYWRVPRIVSRGRTIEIHNRLVTSFEHPMLDVLIDEPALREELILVDLNDAQRAVVWIDGRAERLLGPGRHAFWKGPHTVEVEVFDTSEYELIHRKLDAIMALPGSSRHVSMIRADAEECVLLFREGELVGRLSPGRHVFWTNAGRISAKRLDLRQRMADVSGQEIMTADKVTLRLNMVVSHQVVDPEKAVTVVDDEEQALYREAQLALRAAVGTRTLDDLLADKDAVGKEVREALTGRCAEFGVTVRSVGLRDVILPGEMKMILNQVIEARKQAEANLIRRREETAAARSQANTARLLAENPALARMKELEALQDILRGSKATFVLGREDVVEQVATLVNRSDADGEAKT